MNRPTDIAVAELRRWSLLQLGLADTHPADFSVVSGDASFRKYYRLSLEGDMHFIAVHAPPEKENNEAFIAVQQLMAARQLPVPALLGWDLERGFLLQEDFGDRRIDTIAWPLTVWWPCSKCRWIAGNCRTTTTSG